MYKIKKVIKAIYIEADMCKYCSRVLSWAVVCQDHGIEFVYGRGKRKTSHQRYQELFRRFLDRQLLYDLHTSRLKGRNSYSKNQIPYIKPQTYEKWKKRSFKRDISKRENMAYDEAEDRYTCHAGKKLTKQYIKKQKSKSGYESEVTVYECEDCGGCPYKEACTKACGNKRLYVSKEFIRKRLKSYENITSPQGILYQMNRSIQVEALPLLEMKQRTCCRIYRAATSECFFSRSLW